MSISQKVAQKITKEKIAPIPRWLFVLKNSLIWLFAASLILAGSFCASLIRCAPFWVILLLLAALTTSFVARKSKTGYRRSLTAVIFAVLMVSLIFGLVLNALGSEDAFRDLSEAVPIDILRTGP